MEPNNDTAADSNKRNIDEVDNVTNNDEQRARLDEREYKTIKDIFHDSNGHLIFGSGGDILVLDDFNESDYELLLSISKLRNNG